MTKNISREALYELIWSKPMTYVAKDLGISDVMLGKMCKEQLVMNCDECGQSIHWIDSYA